MTTQNGDNSHTSWLLEWPCSAANRIRADCPIMFLLPLFLPKGLMVELTILMMELLQPGGCGCQLRESTATRKNVCLQHCRTHKALHCWSPSVWLKEKEMSTLLKLLLLNWIFGTAAKQVSWKIHNSSHRLVPPKTLLLQVLHSQPMIIYHILLILPEKNLSNSIPLLQCHGCCLSSSCQDLELRIFGAS